MTETEKRKSKELTFVRVFQANGDDFGFVVEGSVPAAAQKRIRSAAARLGNGVDFFFPVLVRSVAEVIDDLEHDGKEE